MASSVEPQPGKDDLVSIIIPVHNRWDLTAACLESIAAYTPEQHEIIVIDDCSDSDEAMHLQNLGMRVTLIRNDQRRSYSFNNNQAAKVARGKYLCLLNNDTVVTPGWLSALLQVARTEKQVGVIGNKHLFPDNKLLHHCGIGFDAMSHPWHIQPHTHPNLPAANYQRDLQAVSFACVLIPAKVYQQLGGLNEAFNTSYEDCDFCLRAKKSNLRVIYTPASLIYHYGQSTPGRKLNDAANKKVFLDAWTGLIESDFERITKEDQAFNEHEAARPRIRAQGEPGIHLAFDLSQGNSFAWVAGELALALDARGEKVSLPLISTLSPSFEPEKAEKLRKLMRLTPYRSYHVKLNHYWGPYLRQSIHGEVNAEFFLTNYRFRSRPGDIDSWMRHVVASGIRKLAPSKFCKDCLLDVGVEENDIGMAPLGYSPEIDTLFPKDAPLKKRGKEFKILAVTNSHDLKRMGSDVLVKALAEAFGPSDPVVVHIHDYGASSGNKTLRELVASHKNFPRVIWHEEFLPKADLLKFCSQMDAVVAPFRGEGFSMKVLDCMALGVPVLMPAFSGVLEFAAPGTFIPLPHREVPMEECYDTDHFDIGPEAYWCEVEHDGFVKALRESLENPGKLAEVAAFGRNHVRGRFSWDSAAKALVSVLHKWGSERLSEVSIGEGPSTKAISVVIPTKNRDDVLRETLEGYRLQTLGRDQFEIILINDHGDRATLDSAVAPFHAELKITVLDNPGAGGPANARNFGIHRAQGEIVFITGDDIIPTPTLLEKHLEAHKEFPTLETGFIGRSLWHPSLEKNWLMDHLIGGGAQQFNYNGLKDKQIAPFDRFYTSNVSVKRRFISQFETLFNPIFRYAAFEDVEVAHRLRLNGMELRYIERAIGLHKHAMTVRSFLERQRKVGRMLVVFCDVHPPFAPMEHTDYLKFFDLEYQRRRKGGAVPDAKLPSAESLVDLLVASIESIDALERVSTPTSVTFNNRLGAQFVEDSKRIGGELSTTRLKLFDTACDVMMRIGMAEEWAQGIPERQFAKDWIVAFGASRIASSLTCSTPPSFAAVASVSQRSLENRYRDWFKNVTRTPSEALLYFNSELMDIGTSVDNISNSERKLAQQVEVLNATVDTLRWHVQSHDKWIATFSLKGRAFHKFSRVKSKIRTLLRLGG